MWKNYLGHLPEHDPLYQYLKYDIQPQLGAGPARPTYRVFQLNGSNDVYLYEEKHSLTKVIGKFFLSKRERNPEIAARRLGREYHNLAMMRGYGFTGWPHYIARPLGCNDWLNKLLVVEYCNGELLSHIIQRAIQQHDDRLLYAKLTALAYFLAAFHNRTAVDAGVDFQEACFYMDSLINRLLVNQSLRGDESGELYYLRDRWREQPRMWEDRQVFAHGDATPENFLFGDGLSVISFDLERVRRADRVYDTGRIAGELLHFFLQTTGNKYAAEPFIGHFLWEYACHFPDREQAFRATTRRVPFYMGITLLRIARNAWLGSEYRRKLIHEAKQCLRRWQ
ncbi:phosphotransferase [Victivallis sp. Marseille-Q1083]|uniref:phosphotransferase n=1 Tax=Victivallis sp. Marseille-Q1083 TaxID=2717288 RepID=UPI00158E6808|nr:phosphotransferase [Victivallis sp. Marseille-Q1083]